MCSTIICPNLIPNDAIDFITSLSHVNNLFIGIAANVYCEKYGGQRIGQMRALQVKELGIARKISEELIVDPQRLTYIFYTHLSCTYLRHFDWFWSRYIQSIKKHNADLDKYEPTTATSLKINLDKVQERYSIMHETELMGSW